MTTTNENPQSNSSVHGSARTPEMRGNQGQSGKCRVRK